MKKFIVKLILFCTILAGIVAAINMKYISVKTTSSTDKFKNVPGDIQICNFGSSHGANGYQYDDLEDEYTCFNFAMSSQSLDYDWRIMQCFGDNISDDAVVFITISYFSFYGIDETLTDKFLSKNKRYYRFLPKEYIKNYDLKTDIFENRFPALTAYEKLFTDIIEGTGDSDDIEDVGMQRYLETAYKRHLVNEKFDANGNRIINQEYLKALYSMIEFCEEKGAIPILVTTPYLQEYTEIVAKNDPDFLDGFYAIIEKVVKDTGVEYFDYSMDDRFKDKGELFANADHLNHDGAVEFVAVLMKETRRLDDYAFGSKYTKKR